eukprot:scpid105351/ scgid34512/ 
MPVVVSFVVPEVMTEFSDDMELKFLERWHSIVAEKQYQPAIERIHCRHWSRSTDNKATKNKIDLIHKKAKCVRTTTGANSEDGYDRVSRINVPYQEIEKLNSVQARLYTKYASRLRSCCRQVVA